MNYQLFKTAIVMALENRFSKGTVVSITPILKNNHIQLDALTILEPGYHVAPTIYLKEYYEEYQKGCTFREICTKIVQVHETYRPPESFDPSFFSDFNMLKGSIRYKLINTSQNQQLLNDVPNLPFLDLSIVFYCLLTNFPGYYATILIHNSHMQMWQTNTLELYEIAHYNTQKYAPYRFENMTNLLHSRDLMDLADEMEHSPMYVLSNEDSYHGAACLLYDDLLNELALKLNCDFYVIPSSVHEVLILPDTGDVSPAFIDTLIEEINVTQVAPEEILSDHHYYFNMLDKELV